MKNVEFNKKIKKLHKDLVRHAKFSSFIVDEDIEDSVQETIFFCFQKGVLNLAYAKKVLFFSILRSKRRFSLYMKKKDRYKIFHSLSEEYIKDFDSCDFEKVMKYAESVLSDSGLEVFKLWLMGYTAEESGDIMGGIKKKAIECRLRLYKKKIREHFRNIGEG